MDALVGRLEPPRRATWLAEHAQQLPPAEQHALLVALLRHMGVSRWAALLAEVLVELPVQQLASVLAPALVLIPQPAWLELLQELPDASQLQVLEGLLQTQQAEKWVPVVRAQLKSLPPSVAARLREEVPTPLPPHPKAPLRMPPAPLAVAVDPRTLAGGGGRQPRDGPVARRRTGPCRRRARGERAGTPTHGGRSARGGGGGAVEADRACRSW